MEAPTVRLFSIGSLANCAFDHKAASIELLAVLRKPWIKRNAAGNFKPLQLRNLDRRKLTISPTNFASGAGAESRSRSGSGSHSILHPSRDLDLELELELKLGGPDGEANYLAKAGSRLLYASAPPDMTTSLLATKFIAADKHRQKQEN